MLARQNASMSKFLHSREAKPRVLSAEQVADILQISLRHLWNCHASGRLGPRPISLGRSKRWRADEIDAWLAAGAPERDEWDRLQRASSPAATSPQGVRRG
jgi:predicted DNA-binding transcriptional regulator AlpA